MVVDIAKDNLGRELSFPNIFFCSVLALFSSFFFSFCFSWSIFICSSMIFNLSSAYTNVSNAWVESTFDKIKRSTIFLFCSSIFFWFSSIILWRFSRRIFSSSWKIQSLLSRSSVQEGAEDVDIVQRSPLYWSDLELLAALLREHPGLWTGMRVPRYSEG